MKTRIDFVTNSSSSSFILAFKDEDSVYDTLKEQIPDAAKSVYWYDNNKEETVKTEPYFYELLDEINTADRLTVDDVKDIILDEDQCFWKAMSFLENDLGMSYSDALDYLWTDDGKKFIYNYNKEYIDSIIKSISDNKVIVQVEHGDGGEGEDGILEDRILPYLKCTVAQFSHH